MSVFFDATAPADHISAPTSSFNLAGTHSMFCWMKATVADWPEGFAGLMDKEQDEATFGIVKASKVFRVWIEGTFTDSVATITDSAWNHVGYTYDDANTSNEIEIWINGVSDGTRANAGSLSEHSANLTFGQRLSQTRDYTGYLEDAGVWERKLGDNEIKSMALGHMVVGTVLDGIAGWWPLNVPGDAAYNALVSGDLGLLDHAGFGHNITAITQSPTWSKITPGLHWPTKGKTIIAVPAAGGGALVKVVNETSEIADAVARASSLTRVVNETLQMAEGVLNPRALVRISNDTEQIAEGILRPLALTRVVTETETLTEAVNRVKGMVKVVDETANITEAVSKVLGLVVVVNETANITEATVQAKAITIVVNETENLTEAILNPRALVRILNETERIDESLLTARAIVRVVNDTAEIADVVNRLKAMVQVVNETEQLSESTLSVRGLIRVVNEIARISESTATKLILVTATKDEITRIAYIFLTEGRDAFIDQLRDRTGAIDQTQDRDAER